MLSRSSRSLRKALTGIRAFSSSVPDVMVRARRDGDARETSSARREGWRRLIRRMRDSDSMTRARRTRARVRRVNALLTITRAS